MKLRKMVSNMTPRGVVLVPVPWYKIYVRNDLRPF